MSRVNFLCYPVILLGLLVIIFQGSCAKSGRTGRVEVGIDKGTDTGEIGGLEELGDTVSPIVDIYDLEEEMPEEDELAEPGELEDRIDPITPDSFIVEDVSVEKVRDAGYDLGFRVQVFASGELEKAADFKEKVIGETGLDAYIEYEGGLYKVRVGDFKSRGAAAEARSSLVGLYPDCWIVRTTIRK